MLQVKMVWFWLIPVPAGVEVVQAVAAPPTPTVQVTEPAGGVAPTTPLTVAVKTIESPKTG